MVFRRITRIIEVVLNERAVVQLLKNSFKIGEKYTREYIKKELKRLYALVKTAPKNAITAMTIKDFFKIQECKIGNQKAIRILEPLI